VEVIIDKVIDKLELIRQSTAFQSVMEMDTEVKLGDPGIVLVQEYPYIFVEPIGDAPLNETMGRAGWDNRVLTLEIVTVIDISDYFDASVNELPGMRKLIQASTIIKNEFRKLSERSLGGTAKTLQVESINYRPQQRGEDVFTALAVMTLNVVRQYQHVQ